MANHETVPKLRTYAGITETPVDHPHWVVICMNPSGRNREKDPHQRFRHPSEATASAEAQRLAYEQPGKRFAVFAYIDSFKSQK